MWTGRLRGDQRSVGIKVNCQTGITTCSSYIDVVVPPLVREWSIAPRTVRVPSTLRSVSVKFPIKSSGTQWYFTIVSTNGRVLASSERYWNKADAVSAAQTIIDQAGGGTIVY